MSLPLTILITGSTSGIGLATARELAKRGADLVLLGRDPVKMNACLDLIGRESPGAKLHPFLGDLSSQSEVFRLAQEVKKRIPAINVLINNAGGVFQKRLVTKDGLEQTFALNHMSYFILTGALLDLLSRGRRENGSPARIINVSSIGHKVVRGLKWDDLQRQSSYSAMGAYLDSKMMNLLFTFELDSRLKKAGLPVTVNALHPGVIASGWGHNSSGFMKVLMKIGNKWVMSAPEKGARTSVHLAVSPEVEGISGKYFSGCRERPPSRFAQDLDAARRLWKVSEECSGFRYDFPLPPKT